MATPDRNNLKREKTWVTVAPRGVKPSLNQEAHFTHLMEAINLHCAADSSLGGRDGEQEGQGAKYSGVEEGKGGREGGPVGSS